MVNKISVNLNRILNPAKKYNILTIPTHEGYQQMLDMTGHNFYMLRGEGIKEWDFNIRGLPKNHYIYDLPYNQVRNAERFDLVLCQNRMQQWDILSQFASRMNLPIIVLDHTEPMKLEDPRQTQALFSRIGDVNVYITEHNKMSWRNLSGRIIPHGIDTDAFQGYDPQNSKGVSVVNFFPHRDYFCGWTQWNQIKEEGVQIDLIGENPGLSESITDQYQLAEKLAEYRYFVNTSQYSPVPLAMMEAMAVGLPIITTANQEVPKIIQNGYNGFISNDMKELAGYCRRLEQDLDLAKELGANARKTIEEKYSLTQFVNSWNEVFDEAYFIIKK